MHKVVQPKALYFGTPVVLVRSVNEDGATNLAPMSSAWWVGRSCMLGLDATSKTTENLIRDGDCVLNLASADMVGAVDRLALTTGSEEVPEHKANKGFRYEPDKFSAAGLSPIPSDIVNAERVAECSVQLEAKVAEMHVFGAPYAECYAIEVSVLRTHVAEWLLVPGKEDHIDPVRWDPLIIKFTEFFGGAKNVHPSSLARGWGMRHEGTGVLQSEARA